jgi:hypothetical protein
MAQQQGTLPAPPKPSSGAIPNARPSLTGIVLAGRYELRALLGRGGMGQVYEAADRRLDRTVAVKVLRPELAADRRFVARFLREARTAARLGHPRIVAVHDVVRHEGRVFIVLEHVAGRTLSQLLADEGPLAPARVARIGAGVADALAHAHRSGVVHRDVAPGNVMVTPAGFVKVLDFGIAGAVRSGGDASTTLHGTIAYAAPEVLSGQAGDQRVDVYGLGAVLYELLTGRPPFEGSGERDIARRLRVARPVPPAAWDPTIPPSISDLVMRCLARDPRTRPDDVSTVARDLRVLEPGLPEYEPATATSSYAVTADLRPLPGATPVKTKVLPEGLTGRSADDVLRPPAPRRGHVFRVAVAIAVSAVVLGATAIAIPPLLALSRPLRATVHEPPTLDAPASLSADATCDGFASTGVSLTWSGVNGATGYEIWRMDTADAGFAPLQSVDAATTGYRDPDLGVDTSYRYRVRAFDGRSLGAWSGEVDAATPLLCLT